MLYVCGIGTDISFYFQEVPDHRVVNCCDHLLSDILLIALCTYLTGGVDYQDMYLLGKERGESLKGKILQLPNGYPSADRYERFSKVWMWHPCESVWQLMAKRF
jgi:hypothetical protein